MGAIIMFKNSELIKVLSLMKKKLPLYIILLIISSIITAVFLNVVLAYIMKDSINAVLAGDWVFLKRALIIAIISLLVGMFGSPFTNYFGIKIIKKTMGDIRFKTYKHMQNMTINSLEKHHTGDVLSRMTNDLDTIEGIYTNQFRMLVFTIIYGIISMGAIFTLDWKIGLLIFLFGLGTIVINKWFSKPLRKSTDKAQESKGIITKVLIDLLEGIKTIKIFHLEETIFNEFKKENNQLVTSKNEKAKLDASLSLTNIIYHYTRYLGVLVIGLIMAMNKMIDIGSIAAIIHLQGNANMFFNNIGQFISSTKSSLAGAHRVFEFLDRPTESKMKKNYQVIKNQNDVLIRMIDIEMQYEEGTKALNKLNLLVKKGEVTALVGPSGGGKSTILKMMMKFYPINSGELLLDGYDINDYSLKHIRDNIAYVPQDAYLFSGTIAENILYGRPCASMEEVIKAAKLAYADDFIMEQVNGYDTVIGEKGTKLSGGQRQRIAIARALLKDAPLLLLDEATSALDSESEQIVQKALEVLMKGRTTLVVAHRLSTIQHANCIYVIDKGKVVETGIHDELIHQNGLYKKFFFIQFNQ